MSIKLKGQVEFDENDDFVWLKKTKFNGKPVQVGDPVEKAHCVPGRLFQLFKKNWIAPIGMDGELKRDQRDEKIATLERKLAALEGVLGKVPADTPTMTGEVVATFEDPEVHKQVVEGQEALNEWAKETVTDVDEAALAEAVKAFQETVTPDPVFTLDVNGAWAQIMKNGEPYGDKMRKKAAEAKLEDLRNDSTAT